ncbi:hypothetical protein CHUAL_010758 [Chamberlinius hualienensis]
MDHVNQRPIATTACEIPMIQYVQNIRLKTASMTKSPFETINDSKNRYAKLSIVPSEERISGLVMEYKRKRLSDSDNRKLKADKEARDKAFMEKMPTLTNFFKKSEILSMEITLHDNNAQQSNKNEKDT